MLNLVFNIANQSLEFLLELAPNAGTSHDSGKVNRKNTFIVQ